MDSAEKLQLFVRAQHVTAFRRLLWRRMIGMMVAWLFVAWAISLSRTAMVVGIVMLLVPAVWALSFEWRAIRDFSSDQ